MLLENGLYTVRVLRKFGAYNQGDIAGFEPKYAHDLMRVTEKEGAWAEDYTIPPTVSSAVNPGMVAVDYANSVQQDVARLVREAVAPLQAMIAAQQSTITSLQEKLAHLD